MSYAPEERRRTLPEAYRALGVTCARCGMECEATPSEIGVLYGCPSCKFSLTVRIAC